MDGFTFMNPAHAADYAAWAADAGRPRAGPAVCLVERAVRAARRCPCRGRRPQRPSAAGLVAAGAAPCSSPPTRPPKASASTPPSRRREPHRPRVVRALRQPDLPVRRSTMSFEADGTAETSAISTLSAGRKERRLCAAEGAHAGDRLHDALAVAQSRADAAAGHRDGSLDALRLHRRARPTSATSTCC